MKVLHVYLVLHVAVIFVLLSGKEIDNMYRDNAITRDNEYNGFVIKFI